MKRASRWKFLDKYRRKMFLKYEIKQIILNSIVHNQNLPRVMRYYALYNKTKISRLGFKIQHKTRCVRTGRVWSVVPSAKYSRFVFRTESLYGNLPTFKRANW